MAIAGLHNVSILDSSFLRESQSQSQASRQHGDERRPSTRASSLLQMWREIEDEHVVSRAQDGYSEMLQQRRNYESVANLSTADVPQNRGTEQRGAPEDQGLGRNVDGSWTRDLSGTDHEHEVRNNSISGCSDDFGEVERERVREIFQEWMDSSGRERASNVSHMNNNSRAEWLGENEQERVRIIREWVQMNSEQRGASRDGREEQATEVGGHIGRVLDGLVVNQNGDRSEHIRRGNRKLCGRQVLLDMLNKAEQQRRLELQGLMMLRAVSQFAHRNRIQSLLRGRFLRNDRIIEDKRPSCMAASELGLLRQRHTVSGLREGFSKLDHSASIQVSSNCSDTLSNSEIGYNRIDQNEANSALEVLNEFHESSVPDNPESNSCGLTDGRSDLEGGNNVQDISWQESYTHVREWQEEDSDDGTRDWLPSPSVQFVERSDNTRQNLDGNWQETSSIVWSEETLQNLDRENSHPPESGQEPYEQTEPIDWLPSASVEFVERNDDTRQHGHLREAGRVIYEQSDPVSDVSTVNGHTDNVEGTTMGDVNWQEFAAQAEEQEEQVENEETDWHGVGIEYNEWRNGVGENMDANQQGRTGNEWSQELLASEDREDVYMQEVPEVWHEDGSFQEAVQSWLQGPSDQQAVPVGRVDTLYFPEDDNANSTELRELLSRRRVSSLLHSGFRESLDQLIQSYVERQSRAPVDWELHGTILPTPSGEQDSEQRRRDQTDADGVAAGNSSLALPSPMMLPVHSIWDNDSHNDNWQQHDVHHRLGIEWDIINDLRIDMARLQQRMNNMQRMLEACMDMQLELQRCIRQEVSAALNRSSSSQEVCVDGFPEDGSKWDYVRKGICCMCCDNNIDSLLYRCGHMCACSKCANGLVQSGGKCPMCLAPVVEVIRAYSIS